MCVCVCVCVCVCARQNTLDSLSTGTSVLDYGRAGCLGRVCVCVCVCVGGGVCFDIQTNCAFGNTAISLKVIIQHSPNHTLFVSKKSL